MRDPVNSAPVTCMQFTSVLLTAMFAAMLSTALGAQHRYVDAGSLPGGDGVSWSTAFDTLQDALTAAAPGVEIWVAEGTYQGGFSIPAGVQLRGGFRNGDTRESQRDPVARPTILDGGDAQRVLTLGDKCLVDGFEVRNGRAGSPGGGGALVDGTSPTVRNCLFSGNRNTGGRGSTILVRNGGRPLVSNCVVVDNIGFGHVIDIDGAGGTYDHLTVFRNSDNGLHLQNGADAVITNSIFAGNTGRGICDFAFGAVNQPVLENNLFWDNGPSEYHYRGSEYQNAAAINALAYASDNIVAEPGFVNEATTDLRLNGAGSFALERGKAVQGQTPGFDFAGNLRVLDGDLNSLQAPDIGAHEYSNVELVLGGNIVSGGTLEVTFEGKAGAVAVLALGTYDGLGTLLPPYGTVHLYLGQPVVIGVIAVIPAELDIPVPMAIPPGTTFGLQAVIGSAIDLTGNLSRPYDLLIR